MDSVCKNCRENHWTLLFQVSDFDTSAQPYWLGQCTSCGIVSTLGVDEDTVARAYSISYYGSGRFKFSALLEWLLKASNRKTARRILDQWAKDKEPSRNPEVLDIGCGRGLLLRELRSLSASVLGLERPQFPLDSTVDDFIKIGSLQDAQYDGREFDIIIVWHVLEHFTKVDEILSAISRHLREGGLLVIAVPNFGSTQRRIFNKNWFHLDIPRHLHHFDRDWLVTRLKENRFDQISINTFDLAQNTYGFIQSACNRLIPSRSNELYNLLKHGVDTRRLPQLIPWLCLMILVMPFAILELIYSGFTNQGASLIIHARSSSRNVER